MKKEWIKTTERLPDRGVVVKTKIDDEKGIRNIQDLILEGSLWFFSDMSMYTYYTPTHWMSL